TIIFFFSSRRRHTRFSRDWSSDVCSSDLSSKLGNIYALMIGAATWIGICSAAYFVAKEEEFYMLAATVGLVMGGIQALSRATYRSEERRVGKEGGPRWCASHDRTKM